MIRISTILPLVLVSAFTFSSISANSQRTYVDNGTNTNYTLYTGDSLHIKAGTYTGTINSWQSNAKISVASGANFQPTNFGYFLGKIYVYGTAVLGRLDGQTSAFKLMNYGRTTVNGTTYLGGSATLENAYGAVLNLNGALDMNNSTLTNTGVINSKENFYTGNNSTLTNNNIIETAKNFELNGSQGVNSGKLYAAGKMTYSGGTFTNNCKTIADNAINISGTTINNNGLLWATSAKNNASIVNGGRIISTINGKIKSVNFENNSTITGTGYFYFTGTTKINGGTLGISGTTTDSLRVYDVTRTNPSTIFDYQGGTINRNVVYRVFPAPDTTANYPSCGLAFTSSMSVLPIQWNYFTVNVSNNTPGLNWSSEQEYGTVFEVERSYDGTNFSTIKSINAEVSKSVYAFEDKSVNTSAATVHYRIKAIEPSGAVKISETRAVRFAGKAGITVQASPNPFTSQFSISYQSTRKEMISIRIINMAGQQQLVKNATVSNGYNSISINEAASLSKGIYMVQLLNENGVIATERIVKQ